MDKQLIINVGRQVGSGGLIIAKMLAKAFDCKFYDKEIPYCCEIAIEAYREEPTIDRISAVIYVARDSQKGILIGHKGEKLKKVGQQAREDIEQFLGKKVFLELYVKVNENWRDNERQLKRFGYEQE